MFKFMNYNESSSEELPKGVTLLPPEVWRDSTKPWNRERPANIEASEQVIDKYIKERDQS